MTSLSRSRGLRWAAPAVAAAVVAVAASGVLSADANPPLPARTAAQLLVDLQNARVDGLSGTVVQKADLGLPALPNLGQAAPGTSLTSLLTGSHTLRVWYAGPAKQRVALLGNLGEYDVVHNGRDAWTWSSDANTATHYRLPAEAARTTTPSPVPSAVTPQQAADAALKAIDPTTAVTTDGTGAVAGRSVYELVLSPRDDRSLIGQVRLAMDAETKVPLRVQVFPKASADGAAFEVGFTRVSFAVPGDEQFRFSPPPGATVKEGAAVSPSGDEGATEGSGSGKSGPGRPGRVEPDPGKPDAGKPGAGKAGSGESSGSGAGEPRVIGTGWTSVVVLAGVGTPVADSVAPSTSALGEVLNRLPRVSGSWGSGRLLSGRLFSALLTDDGRVLVGAVAPELLYAAAAT